MWNWKQIQFSTTANSPDKRLSVVQLLAQFVCIACIPHLTTRWVINSHIRRHVSYVCMCVGVFSAICFPLEVKRLFVVMELFSGWKDSGVVRKRIDEKTNGTVHLCWFIGPYIKIGKPQCWWGHTALFYDIGSTHTHTHKSWRYSKILLRNSTTTFLADIKVYCW